MIYLLLKWLHVVAAIIAVGANATYGIWIARASRTPAVLPFTLRVIKQIDDRVANPSYGLLLLTGLAMIYMTGAQITRTPWLLVSLVAYVAMALIAALGYTPALKRQIEALDRDGFESPSYQAIARQATIIGIVLAVLSMTIVFLMVVKPRLWAA
jgi:uncharacterized membrane protein